MPELLRVRDVAAVLGISRRVAYDLIRRGALPGVVRVGRAIYVRRLALDAWLRGADGRAAGGDVGGPAALDSLAFLAGRTSP